MENKLDTSLSAENITAKAVVIGCSHNNKGCNHKMHPSEEDFFTIDILQTDEPDLCMDITKGTVPDFLKNKFQLTILENLPCSAYNLDKLSKDYVDTDGEIGFGNANDLTSDDGFIMVVGNSRTYSFRNSLANLNYLEIAKDPNFDSLVLLIPKNQTMNAAEVMQKIQSLPQVLQDSIQTAVSNGYQPLNPVDFCKLNYTPCEKNKALIEQLSLYRTARSFENEYIKHYNILGIEFVFGHSRKEKIDATDAFINVLLGNVPESSLVAHKEALLNGTLGKIVCQHLQGRPISALIDNTENKKQYDAFKTRYTNIKQLAAEEKLGLSSEPKIVFK